MDNEDGEKVTKQIMELTGALKDAAIRVRTGLDNHTNVLSELTQEVKKLNAKVERLAEKA